MSRAFVKDESWEDPVVAPRAPLPDGVPNYVTPRGLQLLRDEQSELETRRQAIEADAALDDGERRRRLAVLTTRMRDLASRVATAEVVAPAATTDAKVRFGARVIVRSSDDDDESFRIVGVDEADPDQGLIAFTSPLARAVLGRAAGDVVRFQAGGRERSLRVEAVEYAAD